MIKSLFLLVFAIIVSSVLYSCDTGNSPSISLPQAPTNLRVTSLGSTSIKLTWTPSRTTVIGYDISLLDNMGSIIRSNRYGNDTVGIVYDLEEGRTYTFSVRARSADTVSKALQITWAPAKRISGKLYANPSKGNGINFIEEKVYELDFGSKWDLCLEVDSSTIPASYRISTPFASNFVDVNGIFISGLDKGLQAKKTMLFNNIGDPFILTGIDSLDYVSFNAPIGAGYTPLQNFADNIQSFTRGFVLLLRTSSNNYIQFHVKAKNNTIIQQSANGPFIDFEASVQRVPNLAFGKLHR